MKCQRCGGEGKIIPFRFYRQPRAGASGVSRVPIMDCPDCKGKGFKECEVSKIS